MSRTCTRGSAFRRCDSVHGLSALHLSPEKLANWTINYLNQFGKTSFVRFSRNGINFSSSSSFCSKNQLSMGIPLSI